MLDSVTFVAPRRKLVPIYAPISQSTLPQIRPVPLLTDQATMEQNTSRDADLIPSGKTSLYNNAWNRDCGRNRSIAVLSCTAFCTAGNVKSLLCACFFPSPPLTLTLMDNQGVSKVVNATAAHVAALTSGTEASTQVAITCLGGHSFGQLLVYTSMFDVESRYLGMKKAFGDDMEILTTTGSSPPQDLRAADYDKLISNAEAAHASSRAASSYVPPPMTFIQAPAPAAGSGTAAGSTSSPASSATTSTGVPAVNTAGTGSPPHQHPPPTPTIPQASEASPIDEPNPYLSVYANFPIIKWGRSVHHPSLTIIYTIIGVFSTFGLLIVKWFKGGSWLFEIVYLTSFLAVNLYTMIMLDVRREVCYIEVSRDDVSAGMQITWETLKAEAKSMPKTKEEALQNLRRGLVCHLAGSETVLVPVMAIMTRIEDAPASWWILFNELRAPIVQVGLYLLPDDHIDWVVIYGVAAYFQARMLRAVAERYIQDAKTRRIFWFRKLRAHVFPVHEKSFYLDCSRESGA
ncbi:NAD-dependent malic enzyme [Salix suchowensis]|nr:NAD-dependent malic enzyme [Salix suchowensis]